MQLLGNHPLCRKHGDEQNSKKRERSAQRRAEGRYSPSIMARWSDATRKAIFEEVDKSNIRMSNMSRAERKKLGLAARKTRVA